MSTPNETEALSRAEIEASLSPPLEGAFQAFESAPGARTLEEIFTGSDARLIQGIKSRGWAEVVGGDGQRQIIGAEVDSEGRVTALAAAISNDAGKQFHQAAYPVPRRPSRARDHLEGVADFTSDSMPRAQKIPLFHRIATSEGLVSNAINKSASLVATKGSYKVRGVKGKRGKPAGTPAEELKHILQFFVENVNASDTDGVVTGSRGINAFLAQGVRLALTEGDHIARMQWQKVYVPALQRKVSLPINIQSFSVENIEIPEVLSGISSAELMYWKPPQKLLALLKSTKKEDKDVREVLEKLMGEEVIAELKKNGKYRLDPKLMIHIKHRGIDTSPYGQSMVEPAMSDIAFKRQLQALDSVTIQNLVNRLVIVKVGSDDPESVYHKAEVSAERLKLLEKMMRQIGPSATILWAGPDISAEVVGAHDSILNTDERYRLVEARIRSALGVPSALLTGEGSDGKAAGWAATVGLAAQLRELQDQYKQTLRSVAERIAEVNGYDEVDVVWEFHQDLLADKEANANVVLKAYQTGLLSTQTAVEEMGFNYEAERQRQEEDVSLKIREKPFHIPSSMQTTTNPGGNANGGGGSGRPTKKTTQKKDPRSDKERKTTEENS